MPSISSPDRKVLAPILARLRRLLGNQLLRVLRHKRRAAKACGIFSRGGLGIVVLVEVLLCNVVIEYELQSVESFKE